MSEQPPWAVEPPAQPNPQPVQFPAPYPPAPPMHWPPPAIVPPTRTDTNGMAIASLVLGCVAGVLLSVIFGIVALVQIKRTGQRGRGLAVAGLALSGGWVLVFGAVVAVIVLSDAPRDAAGGITKPGTVSVDDLSPGDCVNGVSESDSLLSLPAVPCAEPHQGEVFATFTLPPGGWPGESAVAEQAEEGCYDRLAAYAPKVDESTVEMFMLQPTLRTWDRDRSVTCIALHAAGPSRGSLRD